MVAIGHFIYAVGGYDSHSQLRSVERYNTEQNVWEYMTPMLHPRSALSASVLDDKIWVFGECLSILAKISWFILILLLPSPSPPPVQAVTMATNFSRVWRSMTRLGTPGRGQQ